jgi:hypothetical protein
MPRAVTIETVTRNGEVIAYLVKYVQRQKHQRRLAAQFSGDAGVEKVKAWIAEQPDLVLVTACGQPLTQRRL